MQSRYLVCSPHKFGAVHWRRRGLGVLWKVTWSWTFSSQGPHDIEHLFHSWWPAGWLCDWRCNVDHWTISIWRCRWTLYGWDSDVHRKLDATLPAWILHDIYQCEHSGWSTFGGHVQSAWSRCMVLGVDLARPARLTSGSGWLPASDYVHLLRA